VGGIDTGGDGPRQCVSVQRPNVLYGPADLLGVVVDPPAGVRQPQLGGLRGAPSRLRGLFHRGDGTSAVP
jgi:hypothetical protein